MLRIGLLLTGNGALDGSDPLQVAAWRIAASRREHLVLALAPDLPQHDVVGPQGVVRESRHALAESMRLASGVVERVGHVGPEDLDALVVPGGLGAVKTLCSAAVSEPVHVSPIPATLARGLLDQGGVIAVIDEAVVWAAWVFADRGLELASDGRTEVDDDLRRTGHRGIADGTLVRSAGGHVLSRWNPPHADPATVYATVEDTLDAIEAELTRGATD